MKNLRLNFATLSFQNLGELNKALEILDENGIDYQPASTSFAFYEDLISCELDEIQDELNEKDIDLNVELKPKTLADLILGFNGDEYINAEISNMVADGVRNAVKNELPEIYCALMNEQN